jgi:dipeptidyl aminopeptidase/acylaminoacyl peptidase
MGGMDMIRRICIYICCYIIFLTAFPILAGPLKDGSENERNSLANKQLYKWMVDDLVMMESASNFQISPDCLWAVWMKNSPDQEKDEEVSQLMLSSIAEKKTIELTRGRESCTSPKWSSDGQLIAFLSARTDPVGNDPKEGQKPQIWLINPFGGEPWGLTSLPRGVINFEWVDVNTIVFTSQEEKSLYEITLEKNKDTTQVVEDEAHVPPIRLFKVDIQSKKISRLTDNTDRIQSLTVSPDGLYAVTIHDRDLRFVYDQRVKPIVFLYNLKTGERKQIFKDPKFNLVDVKWRRDNQGFYALSRFTTHPRYIKATVTELYYYDLKADSITRIELDWDRGLSHGWFRNEGVFQVTKDGFIALLADGVRYKAARYIHKSDGWRREWLEGEHSGNLFSMELGRDNQTLLYTYSTSSVPVQWYCGKLINTKIESTRPLTELNGHLNNKSLAKSEVIRWKGAMNDEVEGILHYPHQYESGKRYPLVVMIHGGPFGADVDAWQEGWWHETNIMCQQGAFVFKVNYHGSSNYGLKFAESIAGGEKYYDLPIEDIELGVDELISRGLVDGDKLGVLGWSNGAILTLALIVHNNRYKVASAGAGGSEWAADWAACVFGASFDEYYFGSTPISDPQLYIRQSPFYQFDRIRTPTIIFHGTEDRVVPIHHGWMQYRALQQLGNTDVRFILFPGAKHRLEKLSHQRRKLEEEIAWFDKYLFKTSKDENEALKPDSPLANALRLMHTKADGKRYGLIYNGILIPETVEYEGLQIGRFEVTRAQFAEFDRSCHFQSGMENFPANGITFEQAQAYCEWLSQLTGVHYRLGKEEEVEKIYSKAESGENTLDYWAGYSVNPEDAMRLQAKLKELGDGAPLLKEVGSFNPIGKEEKIFDLGGNVAEWMITKDGLGVVNHRCAELPADLKSKKGLPSSLYIGFRIIKSIAVLKTD